MLRPLKPRQPTLAQARLVFRSAGVPPALLIFVVIAMQERIMPPQKTGNSSARQELLVM
jgi:hypothetical protein